jgi:hypothetical protein
MQRLAQADNPELRGDRRGHADAEIVGVGNGDRILVEDGQP